jgi:hypothetical protein
LLACRGFFRLTPGFAPQRSPHQVGHQRHGHQAIEQERDDRAHHRSLRTKGLDQSHQQGDVKPSQNDQIHFFSLCNLGDIKLTDTERSPYQKNNLAGDTA